MYRSYKVTWGEARNLSNNWVFSVKKAFAFLERLCRARDLRELSKVQGGGIKGGKLVRCAVTHIMLSWLIFIIVLLWQF